MKDGNKKEGGQIVITPTTKLFHRIKKLMIND
jgi:hypothetical protein